MSLFCIAIGKDEASRQSVLASFASKNNITDVFCVEEDEAIYDSVIDHRAFVFTNTTHRETLLRLIDARKEMGIHVFQSAEDCKHVPSSVRRLADVIMIFGTDEKEERKRLYRWFAGEAFARRDVFFTCLDSLKAGEYITICRNEANRVFSSVMEEMTISSQKHEDETIQEEQTKELEKQEEQEKTKEPETVQELGPVEKEPSKPQEEIKEVAGPEKTPKTTSLFWRMLGY